MTTTLWGLLVIIAAAVLQGSFMVPMAYVLIYMGDYDSAAWMNHFVPKILGRF